MRVFAASLFALLTVPLARAAPAAKKELTLEDVSGDARRHGSVLVAAGAYETAWRDARRLTWLEGDAGAATLYEYDVATGKKSVLSTPLPIPEEKPAAGDEKDEKKASPRTLPFAGALWSPDGRFLLLTDGKDLFLWDPAAKTTRRLTHDENEEEVPVFSPDGRRLAYVKENDLYTLDLASGKETRLTTSGSPLVYNGRLDWVYEEELAERRSGRSFEWAPDSRSIAYVRIEETPVPDYPIVDWQPKHPRVVPQHYPKAGDPNPIASVHVVDLSGKETASTQGPSGGYVAPDLTFTADSRSVCALLMNRAQDELSVVTLARDGGADAKPRLLLSEKDAAWINSLEPPRFLKDGSGFLFLSERSGFLHLYRHDMSGKLVNAVTKGAWTIEGAPEVDEKNGWVYFLATEADPRGRQVYRARLDGSSFTRLTKERGTHTLDLAPGGARWVDRFSSSATPPKLGLFSADGAKETVLDDPKSFAGDYAVGTTELSSFTGSDGTLYYTKLVKPSTFDPAKKYPVVVSVYGGPHVQEVRDSWSATTLFQLLLAEKGFLVFTMDGRGSWGRGHAFETPILKHMGAQELSDQLEGVALVKKLPYVDPARVGIWGWSYGGYMALYAATHAGEAFKCAVAGAPVVDWTLYDTIYTERYMKMPSDNADGYRASSPLTSAAKLGTKLLILHGTADDNVHLQNTLQFVDALMRARKDFELVPLPGQKHGPRGPARLYVNQRVLEFFEKNL
jgi:dipeptidyl-peptidase-4